MIRRLLAIVVSFAILPYPGNGAAALDVGDQLPVLTLKRTDGSALSTDELRGKLVLIDFWASWCAPCKRSLPWLSQLRERYQEEQLEIVTINVDSDPEKARELAARISQKITQVNDPEGAVAEAFDVQRMPSSYLVDANQRVISVQHGFSSTEQDQVETRLKALLGAQQSS